MEYVGRKVKKEVRGHAACFGSVEAYSPATGLFKVVYDGVDSGEMELAEVSPLLAPPLTLGGKPGEGTSISERGAVEANAVISSGIPRNFVGRGGNPAEFDLNICGGIDLNDDGDRRGGGLGGLHGLDLNEGVNYILHEELGSNGGAVEGIPAAKRRMIDLNSEANEEAEKTSSVKRVRWFDLNVELKEDDDEQHNQLAMEVDKGKAAILEDKCANGVHHDDRLVMAPPKDAFDGGGGAGRVRKKGESSVNRIASDMELRRHSLALNQERTQTYQLH